MLSSFQSIKATLLEKRPLQIQGAQGLSKAFLASLASANAPVILAAENPEHAENLLRDVRFLFGTDHAEAVLHLPFDERTPYHATSPDPLITMERLATLHKLATGTPFRVLVTSIQALFVKTLSLKTLQDSVELIERGALIQREKLIERLNTLGYNRVNTVEDLGTYAVRGSVIDVYWPGNKNPARLDLFGDEIERIHLFDPQTQRTVQIKDEYQFGPVREIQLSDETLKRAEETLRNLADEVEYPTLKLKEKLGDLENKIPFFGIESLLPAFYDSLGSVLELVTQVYGQKNLFVAVENQETLTSSFHHIQKEYEEHYKSALVRGELCFLPGRFLISEETFQNYLQQQVPLFFQSLGLSHTHVFHSSSTDTIRQDILRETTRTDDENIANAHHLLDPLAKKLKEFRAKHITTFLPVASLGGTHRLKELLSPHGLNIRVLQTPPSLIDAYGFPKDTSVHAYTYVAKPEPPSQGALLNDLSLAVFSEEDIFGKRSRRQGQTGKKGGFKTTLSDLSEGDPIVHVEHGVGIFKGLTRLNVRGIEQDYLLLSYAGDDKLYLPVHRINLVQTYSGAEGTNPRLDKLGGIGWQSKKKKVKEAVMAMAQDLLNLYAKRELVKRPVFSAPEGAYWEFEGRFPFETTPDQQKAIDDVLADLQRERPMDRLVCGDVGYGKTEVAMRAAMVSVLSGRQVAVLAPTTVLAQQHGITFEERFKDSGVHIAVVSRFQKPKEVKEILQKTKEGKIDILIGTHRILSSDVHFKNLGFVIIDEEQRFGIKDKEHLKRLRTQTDVLTLSATPIPRTLQMGFFSIRDLSIIETPPVDRRAIRTSTIRFDDEVIKEGIQREISRGGQVYFVHNRVRSINATADYLKRLVPEAKIEVGHGQMDEKDLEDVMVRFIKREFNVLVCTTIIETGIDVPSANTMFIDHADDLGLAQLYQLRGRVGRSKERAFAYLVIPASTEHLTPIAQKRLEILNRFSELGAGFRIAQHDLELRGAGDLLGKSQHGHIATVGYDLYSELLKEAVEELKGQAHEDVPDPDISLPIAALIPEKYVPDLHDRLGYYQRLATANEASDIWDIIGLMNEQYGEAPAEVNALGQVMLLKKYLRGLSARALEYVAPTNAVALPKVVISLGENARLDPAKLADWVKKNPSQLVLTPKMKLIYTPTQEEWRTLLNQDLFVLCKNIIEKIKKESLSS